MFCPEEPDPRPGYGGLQRLFEHINEPAESRYLGWMTTFDEAARMARFIPNSQLDLLASKPPVDHA